MAMRIMHDASAALAVTELNKNANNLQKDLKKVASGMRINSAADDASGYAIGERMAVRLRALNQDIINTQTGSDLIRVAESGVQSVIEELRTLKELALNSINDHNSELDRATLQKEFEQRTANIDNIANETNYNGRILLNGDYRRKFLGTSTIPGGRNVLSTNTVSSTVTSAPVTSSSTKNSVQTSKPVTKTTRSTTTTTSATKPTTGTTEGTPTSTTTTTNSSSVTGPTPSVTSNTVTTDVQTTDNGDGTFTEVKTDVTTRATTNTTVTTDTETTTTVTTKVSTIVSAKEVGGSSSGGGIITNGMTEITSGGVWTFADDYTGNLVINADNVTLVGASTTLNEVYITDNSTNLYMKNVKINNTNDKAAIAFTGTTGKLHVLGSNSITSTNSGEIWNNAIINSSGDMKLVGTGSLNITRSNSGVLWGNDCRWNGAIIGGNASQTCGDISIGTGVIVNITGDYTGGSGCSDNGAAVGSGHNGSCGDISIGSSSKVTIYQNNKIAEGSYSGSSYGAGIGAGDSGGSDGTHSSCGNITLYSEATISIIREGMLQAPCIGTGRTKSSCGNITIYSSTASPGIFTQDCQYRDDGSHGRFASTMVGPGPDRCACGNIIVRGDDGGQAKNFASAYLGSTIEETPQYGVVPTYGPYGASSTCESVYMSASLEFVYSNDADELDPTETYYEVTTETITTTTTTVATKETKTTEYETVTDTITGTTTTVYEPKEENIEHYNAPLIIHTGTKANQHLRVYIEDMRPEALGIDKAKIDPQEAAIESLAIIDGAIDYAIEQATHLGAYISRLGHTENTLTADSENTQASESTIRDADMALEMLHYTKDNILAQTAQAMLAQANQNASSVLSLLQ